jgi:hypothetical protein
LVIWSYSPKIFNYYHARQKKDSKFCDKKKKNQFDWRNFLHNSSNKRFFIFFARHFDLRHIAKNFFFAFIKGSWNFVSWAEEVRKITRDSPESDNKPLVRYLAIFNFCLDWSISSLQYFSPREVLKGY